MMLKWKLAAVAALCVASGCGRKEKSVKRVEHEQVQDKTPQPEADHSKTVIVPVAKQSEEVKKQIDELDAKITKAKANRAKIDRETLVAKIDTLNTEIKSMSSDEAFKDLKAAFDQANKELAAAKLALTAASGELFKANNCRIFRWCMEVVDGKFTRRLTDKEIDDRYTYWDGEVKRLKALITTTDKKIETSKLALDEALEKTRVGVSSKTEEILSLNKELAAVDAMDKEIESLLTEAAALRKSSEG